MLNAVGFLGSCHTLPVALYQKEPSWVRGVGLCRVGGVQKRLSDPGDVGAVPATSLSSFQGQGAQLRGGGPTSADRDMPRVPTQEP